MSTYIFPPEGGLKFTTPQGRTIGIWTEDLGSENTYIFVGELTTRGEWANGFHSVLIEKSVLFAEIKKRPDINGYLQDLGYDINATIRRILTSPPPFPPMPQPPGPLLPVTVGNVVPELNKAQGKNFELVAGADGIPVYRRKAGA